MYTAVLISAMAMGGLFASSSCQNGNCGPELDATPSNVQTAQFRMRGRRRMSQREPQREASFVAPAPEPVLEPLSEDFEVEREARILERLRQIGAEAAGVVRTPEYRDPYAAPVPSQTGVQPPQITREDIRDIARDALAEILADRVPPPPPPEVAMKAKTEEGWAVPGSLGALVVSFIGLAWKYRA